jgi:hypothetical protein
VRARLLEDLADGLFRLADVLWLLGRTGDGEDLTLLRSSEPLTLMNVAWHSFATAFASSVFPHPGGP